jgi:predicted enzyme related to lactoylglutathione lyase
MPGSAGEIAQQEDLGIAGTFRTALLHTRDVATAARFYAALFGWALEDTGAGKSFTLRGKRVAGVQLTSSHDNIWIPYVAVDDVAASAATATQAGGKIANPPGEQDITRRVIVKDPEGAAIGLCSLDDRQAATLTGGAGTIWWTEVLAQTPAVLQEFYAHLFQWQSTEQALAPHPLYVMWKRGEKAVGGLLPIAEGWEVFPRWQLLFRVDDLEASTARVIKAGGSAEFGPLDIPRAGVLTSVRDPRGALFVLVQPRSKS